MGTFTMKVFPALVMIVKAAGFCRAKHLGDTSSVRYRCPVKDKIVRNRYNAFEVIRDIGNWRKCGKICNRPDGDGDGNGYCSFWSFYDEICYLYPSDADKESLDLPGAFSGERGCPDQCFKT